VNWVYSLSSRMQYWVYVRDTILSVLPFLSAQKYLFGRFFLICRNVRVFRYLLLKSSAYFNPLNAELNPICHLLALLGTHPILHVSRIRVNVQKNHTAFYRSTSLLYYVIIVRVKKNMCSSVELRNVSGNVRCGNSKELELWKKTCLTFWHWSFTFKF